MCDTLRWQNTLRVLLSYRMCCTLNTVVFLPCVTDPIRGVCRTSYTLPFLDVDGEFGLMGEGCEREDVAVLMRKGRILAGIALSRLSATPIGVDGAGSTTPLCWEARQRKTTFGFFWISVDEVRRKMFILNFWLATEGNFRSQSDGQWKNDARIIKSIDRISSNPLRASCNSTIWKLGWSEDTLEIWSLLRLFSGYRKKKKKIKYEEKSAICTTYRSRPKVLSILPIALILFLIILLRSACSTETVVGDVERSSSCSSSSSLVHVFKIATNISVTGRMHQRLIWIQGISRVNVHFSPTNGKLHVKTSIKFGNQKGCGVQLNCRMFITLLSYLRTVALLLYTSR